MLVERLQLFEYRNFELLQLKLSPRLNFFVGENGQGKTNLLEAVYLLGHGSTFRPTESKSLVRSGKNRSKISARMKEGSFDYSVDLSLEPGRRSAVVNGKKVSSAVLLKTFPAILFSPESLSAIKEGPEQRRLLLDEILISHAPHQANLLREYSKTLKTRNKVLKNLRDGVHSRRDNELTLESLNKIYLVVSAHLTVARIQALNAIEPHLREAMAFITGSGGTIGAVSGRASGATHEEITTEYLISDMPARHWSESQVYDALHNRSLTLASQEKLYGSSLVGPHKHDVKFLFNGNDSRFYCSQGQQRALILSLKIAQIVYHHRVHQTYPVLLLDDVLSELDLKKRANLMKFLEEISAQILITSTDLTWSDQFSFDRNSIFKVVSGQVTELSQ